MRALSGLHDVRPSWNQTVEWVGVFKNLMIWRNDDFHFLKLGIGDFHRFWTEREVEISRSPTFFRTILGCRFRMQAQYGCQDIGKQFSAGNRSVPSDGMESYPQGLLRQQVRIVTGFQGHRNGLRISLFQLLLNDGHFRRCSVCEKPRAKVKEGNISATDHVLECCHQMPRLEIMPAETKNSGVHQREPGQSGNPRMTFRSVILNTSVEGLIDKLGEGGRSGTFQNRHRLFPLKHVDNVCFREGMK